MLINAALWDVVGLIAVFAPLILGLIMLDLTQFPEVGTVWDESSETHETLPSLD